MLPAPRRHVTAPKIQFPKQEYCIIPGRKNQASGHFYAQNLEKERMILWQMQENYLPAITAAEFMSEKRMEKMSINRLLLQRKR